MPDYKLRPMTAADLPAVLTIQAMCYDTTLIENEVALASRLALAPALCWVAESTQQSARIRSPSTSDAGACTLGGYLLTHPWPADSIPPWNGLLPADTARVEGEHESHAAPVWFIHDMAIAPVARGDGLAQWLFDAARHVATSHRMHVSRLVAVQSAAAWWQRHGYAAVPAAALPDGIARKLESYGPGALLMESKMPALASPRTLR